MTVFLSIVKSIYMFLADLLKVFAPIILVICILMSLHISSLNDKIVYWKGEKEAAVLAIKTLEETKKVLLAEVKVKEEANIALLASKKALEDGLDQDLKVIYKYRSCASSGSPAGQSGLELDTTFDYLNKRLPDDIIKILDPNYPLPVP